MFEGLSTEKLLSPSSRVTKTCLCPPSSERTESELNRWKCASISAHPFSKSFRVDHQVGCAGLQLTEPPGQTGTIAGAGSGMASRHTLIRALPCLLGEALGSAHLSPSFILSFRYFTAAKEEEGASLCRVLEQNFHSCLWQDPLRTCIPFSDQSR